MNEELPCRIKKSCCRWLDTIQRLRWHVGWDVCPQDWKAFYQFFWKVSKNTGVKCNCRCSIQQILDYVWTQPGNILGSGVIIRAWPTVKPSENCSFLTLRSHTSTFKSNLGVSFLRIELILAIFLLELILLEKDSSEKHVAQWAKNVHFVTPQNY